MMASSANRKKEIANYLDAAADIFGALVDQLHDPDPRVALRAMQLSLVVMPVFLPEEYAARLRRPAPQ